MVVLASDFSPSRIGQAAASHNVELSITVQRGVCTRQVEIRSPAAQTIV
jgi:hypothetical protein